MPDTQNGRVAVYLDFDNIVLSWYDRVHGRNAYGRDRQKIAEDPTNPEIAARLEAAMIDVGAIIDYASSFGTLVLTRAYADWSATVNADYRSQLVSRAIDLVQLFPAAAYAKNGADIRLAVDAVEDMFRLTDLTHVVIVGGDSDYVPLAQRCKRLGRYVVGIGVAGSTAKSLTAACDEFASYDALPGVERPVRELPERRQRREKPAPAAQPAGESAAESAEESAAPAPKKAASQRRSSRAKSAPAAEPEAAPVERSRPEAVAEPEPEIDLTAVPEREDLGALFVDDDLIDF
ncbi:NYN domain-containing protein, partial [Leucobacter sp. M11]|uniref:NYN domain-containing protein n=1 Tax=Leucobacter sp. M11 TaxID=2993565 RepID=UPI002D809B56